MSGWMKNSILHPQRPMTLKQYFKIDVPTLFDGKWKLPPCIPSFQHSSKLTIVNFIGIFARYSTLVTEHLAMLCTNQKGLDHFSLALLTSTLSLLPCCQMSSRKELGLAVLTDTLTCYTVARHVLPYVILSINN